MGQGIATGNNVFRLYDVDTGSLLDSTVSVELPSFELMSNTFKGAGAGGEAGVPVPGMMNAQTVTLSVPSIYGAMTRFMELGTTRTLDLRNELIVNDKDTYTLVRAPNRWVLKGPISQANPEKVEQGAAGDASIVMQVYYAHHWLDGAEVLEWDIFKLIYTVNGVDLMAETRRNVMVG